MTSKIQRFLEGWDSVDPIYVKPSGTTVAGRSKAWDEILEDLSIFECYVYGQIEARKYLSFIENLNKAHRSIDRHDIPD